MAYDGLIIDSECLRRNFAVKALLLLDWKSRYLMVASLDSIIALIPSEFQIEIIAVHCPSNVRRTQPLQCQGRIVEVIGINDLPQLVSNLSGKVEGIVDLTDWDAMSTEERMAIQAHAARVDLKYWSPTDAWVPLCPISLPQNRIISIASAGKDFGKTSLGLGIVTRLLEITNEHISVVALERSPKMQDGFQNPTADSTVFSVHFDNRVDVFHCIRCGSTPFLTPHFSLDLFERAAQKNRTLVVVNSGATTAPVLSDLFLYIDSPDSRSSLLASDTRRSLHSRLSRRQLVLPKLFEGFRTIPKLTRATSSGVERLVMLHRSLGSDDTVSRSYNDSFLSDVRSENSFNILSRSSSALCAVSWADKNEIAWIDHFADVSSHQELDRALTSFANL